MTVSKTEHIINRIVARPLYQGIVIFLFSALLASLDRKGSILGVGSDPDKTPWLMMGVGMLFYALTSSVLSLKTKDQNTYWREAMLVYIGMILLSAGVATLLSGGSTEQFAEFRWLFIVLTVGYLVFCAIVRLIRKIVELAIEQDDKLRGEE